MVAQIKTCSSLEAKKNYEDVTGSGEFALKESLDLLEGIGLR